MNISKILCRQYTHGGCWDILEPVRYLQGAAAGWAGVELQLLHAGRLARRGLRAAHHRAAQWPREDARHVCNWWRLSLTEAQSPDILISIFVTLRFTYQAILQKYLSVFHWPQNSDTMSQLSTHIVWSSRANKDGSKMEAEQYFSVVYNIFSSSSKGHRSHHMTGPSLCHETSRHETLMESCGQRKAKNNTKASESVYQLRYLHS